MKKNLDFHLHTHYSDGEDSPQTLIDKKQSQLSYRQWLLLIMEP